jgi:hypothetical protein
MFSSRQWQPGQTSMLIQHARRLGQQLADLTRQVRQAVATVISETLARLAQDAVHRVLVLPRYNSAPLPRRTRPADDMDPWAEDLDQREWRQSSYTEPDDDRTETPTNETLISLRPIAWAAGLGAASWWLRRRGTLLGALAMALMAGTFVLFGDAVAADSINVILQHL